MRRDLFIAYLVRGCTFEGPWDMPKLSSCNIIPSKLIPFSKRKQISWSGRTALHFYENDVAFASFLHTPDRYLASLQKFTCVITPDCSIFWDMPRGQKVWEIYQDRAYGWFLQQNGIPIIPNVRYGNPEIDTFCFDGLPHHSVIAVGTHGCIVGREAERYHYAGLTETIDRLLPSAILIYGPCPFWMRDLLEKREVQVVHFDCWTKEVFNARKDHAAPLFTGECA